MCRVVGSGADTHDEPTALMIDILLQRRLIITQRLGEADTRNLGVDLIIHHGIADVLDQAAEFFHISGTIQEPRNLALLFQRDELLKNLFQLPSK